MIRVSLCALLVGLPLAASGQSGVVRYDQATRFDFNFPPNMARNPEFMANLPKAAVKPMQLRFTAEAAVFGQAPVQAPVQGSDAARAGVAVADVRVVGGSAVMVREVSGDMIRADGANMAFMMGGGGPSDAVSGAFTDLANGSYVEVREFLGRTFRIQEQRPVFAWKLTGQAASFLGHPVYQAIAKQDSTTIEAWFTPDIPVSAGPAQYGGLPGLILTLAVDSNRVVYTATAVDLKTPVGKVTAPSEGKNVTRAEYDGIVAEKQAELAKSRRGRGH